MSDTDGISNKNMTQQGLHCWDKFVTAEVSKSHVVQNSLHRILRRRVAIAFVLLIRSLDTFLLWQGEILPGYWQNLSKHLVPPTYLGSILFIFRRCIGAFAFISSRGSWSESLLQTHFADCSLNLTDIHQNERKNTKAVSQKATI